MRAIATILSLVGMVGLIWAADWSYDANSEYGPEYWAETYPYCGGQDQSPIDITGAVYDKNLDAFDFNNFDTVLENVEWSFEDNGHSAQMTTGDDFYWTSGGGLPGIYKVAQFHFHWGSNSLQGSEHFVDGEQYPLEMHIVHFNSAYGSFDNALEYEEGLAVMSVFFEISRCDNPLLDPIIKGLANIRDDGDVHLVDAFKLTDLMPGNLTEYYRYYGSLTTPTCDEVVIWSLFKEIVEISENQIVAFRQLKDHDGCALVNNFRPLQALNGREITASFET